MFNQEWNFGEQINHFSDLAIKIAVVAFVITCTDIGRTRYPICDYSVYLEEFHQNME